MEANERLIISEWLVQALCQMLHKSALWFSLWVHGPLLIPTEPPQCFWWGSCPSAVIHGPWGHTSSLVLRTVSSSDNYSESNTSTGPHYWTPQCTTVLTAREKFPLVVTPVENFGNVAFERFSSVICYIILASVWTSEGDGKISTNKWKIGWLLCCCTMGCDVLFLVCYWCYSLLMNTVRVAWIFPKVTWSETMPCLCSAAVGTKNVQWNHEAGPLHRPRGQWKGTRAQNLLRDATITQMGHLVVTLQKQPLAEAKKSDQCIRMLKEPVVPLDIHETNNHNWIRSVHKWDFSATVEMCLMSVLHLSYLSFINHQCEKTQMDIPGEQKPRWSQRTAYSKAWVRR